MMYNNSMDTVKSRTSHTMDQLFHTGYPHPINIFATLVLLAIPVLSPFAGGARGPWLNHGLAGLLAVLYLVVWSRLRVYQPGRPLRSFWWYLLTQTAVCSFIYALDGGLTRFLFVVVAVQAVYISPVRRWVPFLSTLTALWLTLYLAISPDPGASMVATIGMYFSYLLFAVFVTFTAVQQERQNQVAQELLDGVDRRHHMLRGYEVRIAHRSESEERERLAQTICATLLGRLGSLTGYLEDLLDGTVALDAQTARTARLEAKDVLTAVRQAVRTLRPGEGTELDDEDDQTLFPPSPEPEITVKWTDPIRVYHIWNVGVIILTMGVAIASALVGGGAEWLPLLAAGLFLLAAYGAAAIIRPHWGKTLFLVLQAGLIVWIVRLADEPLLNHLFLMVAAQMVFLVPTVSRWLVTAVAFPTVLSAFALWRPEAPLQSQTVLWTLTAAFGVTNFFGAVMAFLTQRQVEARERALIYAQQLAEVNRLLEGRLQEIRRMAIAGERVRMAREIHDGLGHHLTIVIVDLQYAEALAQEDPEGARSHIASARRMIDAAMVTARELVETLDRFDRPLPEALSDLVATWGQGNGIEVNLRIHGDCGLLSTAARITLFRAVQECLTNIQKHARARKVDVVLLQLRDRVILMVANDNAGEAKPVPEQLPGRGGWGLVGLKERAEALQGEFQAGPRPGGGFEVKLVLPLGA